MNFGCANLNLSLPNRFGSELLSRMNRKRKCSFVYSTIHIVCPSNWHEILTHSSKVNGRNEPRGEPMYAKGIFAERSIRFSLIPKWKIISIFMKDDEKMIDKFMDSSLKCNLAVAEGEPQMVDYWFSRRADWMAKWAFPRKNNDLLRWRMHHFSFNGNFFTAWIGYFHARQRVIWVVKPIWRLPWPVFGWRRRWPSRFSTDSSAIASRRIWRVDADGSSLKCIKYSISSTIKFIWASQRRL